MVLNRIVALLLAGALSASAFSFPDKPIRIVNGFAAGGGSDILLRALLPAFSEKLGQPMVVDYRVGDGGHEAIEAVTKAAPDGDTLLTGFAGLAPVPFLNAKLPFDPITDLAPVTLVGIVPNVLMVHPAVPIKSVREFVAYARAHPGRLSFTSPGAGTT